ncbi:hypothetical protein [Nocardiopsis gilva]|uniref:hypothetical protein n=1 Tax=Nocardiopsis gilva TaxID=280236 RepID=UPI003743D15A
MLDFQNGLRLAHLLYVVAELGAVDQLLGGPLPVEEIAKRVDAHPPSLKSSSRRGQFYTKRRVFSGEPDA